MGTYFTPKNSFATPSLPLGKINDLDKRVAALEAGGGGGGSLTKIVVSGTINDSNVTFTSASNPTYLVINGMWYEKTGGAITWSWSAGTITLSSAVGTGGAIWGF